MVQRRRMIGTGIAVAIGMLGSLPAASGSAAPAPAQRATDCHNTYHSDRWHQNCSLSSNRITGTFNGSVSWDYRVGGDAGSGYVSVDINDTDSAACAAMRVRYRDPEFPWQTVWSFACNGNDKIVNLNLNNQTDPFEPWLQGHYYVDFCDGKQPDTCITQWSVNVADTAP